MNRILYFIKILWIQIPMIWRQTGHRNYFYRHYFANDDKSAQYIRNYLHKLDKKVKLKRKDYEK